MRLVLFTFPLAIAVGFVLGGRSGTSGGRSFRHGWAGLLGVALQFLPIGGTPGYLPLVVSLLLLLFVSSVNWKLPGFLLVLVGLWMNFLVIVVNEGMPVTREAVVASGQADTLDDLRRRAAARSITSPPSDDELLFLADRIAVPSPVRQAVSVGDIVAYVGAMWFVIEGMRRRSDRDLEADLSFAGASA